jgi:hypothetical protein
MDVQRCRRTRDQARRVWYAYDRQMRFARWLGFVEGNADVSRAYRSAMVPRAMQARSEFESLLISAK